MLILTKNLIAAAREIAAAHKAEATRHTDPNAWKKRLHHTTRAASAASLADDIAAIEADLTKGSKP